MPPKRKKTDIKLKSVWDENLILQCLSENGAKSHHAKKLWNYLISHPDVSLENVPLQQWSVPRAAAETIKRDFVKFTSKIVQQNESAKGDTTKLLIELQDGGHSIETVIMRHRGHATVCISSQIGCQMGCRFCATGTMGIIGNLTSAEILEQFAFANNITRIRNVVFMGMGEPLNNFENVKLAIQCMVDNQRFGLSPKHITVSTVGVIGNMYRLTDELQHVNLALSLHAPNQELRVKIVPSASGNNIDKLMAAVDYHIKSNTRPLKTLKLKTTSVMIEYILIRGVNDTEANAHELAQLLSSRRAYIILNLIPYNPTNVAEDYAPPLQSSIKSFFEICTSSQYRIYTRVRQEMGQDIAGACGQLALVNPNQSKDIEDTFNNSKRNNNLHPILDYQDYIEKSEKDELTENQMITPGNYKTKNSLLLSIQNIITKNNTVTTLFALTSLAFIIRFSLKSFSVTKRFR